MTDQECAAALNKITFYNMILTEIVKSGFDYKLEDHEITINGLTHTRVNLRDEFLKFLIEKNDTR